MVDIKEVAEEVSKSGSAGSYEMPDKETFDEIRKMIKESSGGAIALKRGHIKELFNYDGNATTGAISQALNERYSPDDIKVSGRGKKSKNNEKFVFQLEG